jgi:DNA-binding CsgD family transcriptional regulator
VEQAAAGLDEVGLWWDGARLAGQAAIRTKDRKAMVALLECARMLQGRSTGTAEPGTPDRAIPRQAGSQDGLGENKLSDRERQVAELVLDGLTYREVGDRLFISAKTVEHHMARMRQRLGVSSRSELLAALRQLTERR